MPAFEKKRPDQVQLERIPKSKTHLLLFALGILIALGAAVLMIVGFADAGLLSPGETEGPAPDVAPGAFP